MPESAPADYLSGLFCLAGRTAIITGGGGYLGGAIAKGMAQSGASVVLVGRTLEKLDAKAGEIREAGGNAFTVAADCGDIEAVRTALQKAENELGPADILVNAAGGNLPAATVPPGESFFDIDPEGLRKGFDLNLMAGAMIPTIVFGKRLEDLSRPGNIINIASVASVLPLTRLAGYSPAKAAVKSFTEWLAVNLAQRGEPTIRVNAIIPGFFLTEQNRFLLTEGDGLSARGKTIIGQTPMGRFGEPEELIGAALYLASEAGRFVTGTSIIVDGGFCAFSGV